MLSGTPTLLLDVGDNLPAKPPGRELMAFVFSTFKHMGYQVVNVGPFDLGVPTEEIREGAQKGGIALVGGSITASGAAPWASCRLLNAGGLRVAVLGAAPDPGSADGGAAIEEVRRTVRRIRASVDLVVVLSQLAPDDVERCLTAVPGVDVFISGRHDVGLTPKLHASHAWILPCSLYGQSVGVAELRLSPNRRLEDVVVTHQPVDARLAYDPAVKASVARFYAEHSQVLMPDKSVRAETNRVLAGLVGSSLSDGVSCESCHRREYDSWRTTRHAHAWQTLVEKGAAARSDCVPCHTANKLEVSNFSPLVTGVSCAVCHGGDPQHVRYPSNPRFVVRRPSESVCQACHVPPQDRRFSYQSSLLYIMHNIPGKIEYRHSPVLGQVLIFL